MAERRPGLDGLRGAAVLLVMTSHLGFTALSSWGMAGVNVFFVLSGFLITGILLRERERKGSNSLRAFWERRARRLLPALIFLLGLMALGQWLIPSFSRPDLAPWPAYIGGLFFYNNWLWQSQELGLLTHLWSLAVEEQFYLFWPLAFLFLMRLGSKKTVRTAAAFMLAVSLVASWVYFPLTTHPFTLTPEAWGLGRSGGPRLDPAVLLSYAGTGPRLYGLAAGIILATLPPLWSKRTAAAGVGGLSIVLLVPSPLHGAWEILAIGPLSVLATVLVIGACGDLRVFTNAFLRYCGRRSYALYLWSPVLSSFALAGTSAEALASLLSLTALAFLMAELSWRLVEKPVLIRGPKRAVATLP